MNVIDISAHVNSAVAIIPVSRVVIAMAQEDGMPVALFEGVNGDYRAAIFENLGSSEKAREFLVSLFNDSDGHKVFVPELVVDARAEQKNVTTMPSQDGNSPKN